MRVLKRGLGLCAVVAAVGLAGAASPASAKMIRVTGSGVVGISNDATGVFGTVGSLEGDAFSYVATYDLSAAGYFNNGMRSDLFGGTAYLDSTPPVIVPPIGHGTLTINGQSFSVGGTYNSWLFASTGANAVDFQFVQDFVNDGVTQLNDAIQMVERPSFGLFAADYTPPAGNLCRVDGCEGSSFGFRKVVDGVVVRYAYGNLAPDEVRISEISSAPEPAGWVLMIGGFGLAGAGLRRRAAAAGRRRSVAA